MKSYKKIFAGGMALACLLSTGTGTFAAEGKTDVAYDNSHQIVDPSDPTWAVRIPSALEVEDTYSKVQEITLINKSGTNSWPSVDLFVKSQNGYQLLFNGIENSDNLDYAMAFGQFSGGGMGGYGVFDKNSSGKKEERITQLNEFLRKIECAAERRSTAKQQGNHSDILTFRAIKVAK